MGTILGILFSGMMASALGWEAVFYIQGALAVPMVLVWLFLVHDSPSTHPRIGQEEREYIQSTTAADDAKAAKVNHCLNFNFFHFTIGPIEIRKWPSLGRESPHQHLVGPY